MPKVSKTSASQEMKVEGIAHDRSEDLDGYTVSFTEFLGDMDGAPMLRGAPNDQCQCPHFGYVFKGKMTFRFDGREETYEAGDAFYAPAGHTPFTYEGAEVLMFQPTDELQKTMDVMMKNFQGAGQQA
jgi:glyoxylate utilization-related uncharacterized protein